MKIWWFYSDKIFPNYGPDEKIPMPNETITRYHRNWLTAARSRICTRGTGVVTLFKYIFGVEITTGV
ncbi:hypothetical protein HanRHA438_Chr12g0561891 [Helianthus annuus]|nr:hypothetical protein HanIR_Chr12g0594161 [Helianthus annuus]KAJ0867324.1 hypothetical protein HanRHA438_Chr12g0561891 [Helianthus annuus]